MSSPRRGRTSGPHLSGDQGIVPKTGYARFAVPAGRRRSWLATGLDGRSPKTIKKNQNVLEPILKIAGARKFRELSAADVRQALACESAGLVQSA